jgi:hypothetical protein
MFLRKSALVDAGDVVAPRSEIAAVRVAVGLLGDRAAVAGRRETWIVLVVAVAEPDRGGCSGSAFGVLGIL